MVRPYEQRHVRIITWQVVNGRVSFLLQQKCSLGYSDYRSSDRYTDPSFNW
jgi:hypothetical protein